MFLNTNSHKTGRSFSFNTFVPLAQEHNMCANLISCCHLVETTWECKGGRRGARIPHGDQRARLSIKLPGSETAQARLPAPGLCKMSHVGRLQHFLLLLSLDSCGSQILNVILSRKSFKITICSFFLTLSFWDVLKEGRKEQAFCVKKICENYITCLISLTHCNCNVMTWQVICVSLIWVSCAEKSWGEGLEVLLAWS